MKTPTKKFIALVVVAMLAISFSAFSQDTKDTKVKSDDGKMHIKIEIEKDGKVTKVDTTINPEDMAALNEHLKELDVHLDALDDLPGHAHARAFSFSWDGKELEEHMKVLEERLKDSALFNFKDGELLNMEEFEKQMEKLGEKIKNNCYMYKYKIEADSATEKELLELEEGLKNLNYMNFNFNDDGKSKTVIIKTDDTGKEDGKSEKKTIIKRKGKADQKDSKEKKVIIIMKTSGVLEKQKAEFAEEPVNKNEGENTARVRFVDKEKNPNNSWLNNLTCYPNPSSGEFTISFQLSNPEAAELKIMDISGREVFAENLPENSGTVEKQITLPAKSSAAYLLILRQGNNWHHEKIFVKS